MGKQYYYEVDYRSTCEVCGKPLYGVIRRGPLEYNKGGVIPTGMASAFDAADIALCRKAILDAVERSDNPYLIASNADHCPHCGARQSCCTVPVGRIRKKIGRHIKEKNRHMMCSGKASLKGNP